MVLLNNNYWSTNYLQMLIALYHIHISATLMETNNTEYTTCEVHVIMIIGIRLYYTACEVHVIMKHFCTILYVKYM